ncbi:MAG: aryl-alcohol dehydrogenase-like predicted oxidoreductase [Candidatus Nitrosomirales archaeon]|jgi:aryl-alcohol dehydrogenase-like predicted oxidoreductase
MKYRKLGKSGIMVSEIGFGAWSIGLDWWGKKIDDEEGLRMLKRAYDLGITFYDTADIYGKGRSEKLIAQAFKGMRNEVVLSTKFGYDIYSGVEQIGHNELPQKFDEEFVRFALGQSLERLETDYIDLYNLHNPKMSAIQDDSIFRLLNQLINEGKIRHYGAALGPAIGWRDEGILAMENRNVTAIQTVYNILEQDPGQDFFKVANEMDVGVLVRVPDASGVLTGKVNANTDFGKDDHRSHRKREFIIQAMKKVDNLKPFAESKGWNITELAIKFILSEKTVSSVLPTVTSIEELEMFANISDGKYLDEKEYAQVKEMYSNNFYVKVPEL